MLRIVPFLLDPQFESKCPDHRLFRECVRVLKGFEATNLRQLIQHVTPPPPNPFFSSAWKSLTQIKETWIKHVCLDMLTKFDCNNGKWCFLKTEMMQIRYSITKLNKHIIKETKFDSARPCSNTILAINFLVQILSKAGGNQTRDLKFWDVFPYFPKYGKDMAKNDKIGQKPPKTSQGVAGRRRASQKTSQDVAENVAGVAENVAGRRRTSQARFLPKIVVFAATFKHTFRVKMQIFD